MRKKTDLWKYIIAIIGLFALVILIRDFNSRMADLRRLTADKASVAAQLTELVATKQTLETQVAYSLTDDAVREYAYEKASMQQPDDHLAIPIPAPGDNSEPTPQVIITEEPVQNWQLWLALFVDPKPVARIP
jgi:cell division protein FtsB